jgi:hypothetical protein
MTTKKFTRTFELTVEKSERFAVQVSKTFLHWCNICASGEQFAPPEEIARRFEITQREVYRLIEKGRIGFSEEEGSTRVCMKCFEGERNEK